MENFCTWTDANAFMRACLSLGERAFLAPRDLIEPAQRIESPLELVMLCAIKTADKFIGFHDQAGDFLREFRQSGGIEFDLRPAVPVGTYRADMIMQAKVDGGGFQPAPVVVECDGFNYHDKTRAQACHDRARDRYMQRQGYVVARFAGDEIVEQPFACAFEVFDLVLRGVARVDRDAHPPAGWPVFVRRNEGDDSGPLTLNQYYLTSEVE